MTDAQILLSYQYRELGKVCGSNFYARQLKEARILIEKFGLEPLLDVLKFYKEVGLPRKYKSIYYLKNNTEQQIEIAKNYFSKKKEKIEESAIINKKLKNKIKISWE